MKRPLARAVADSRGRAAARRAPVAASWCRRLDALPAAAGRRHRRGLDGQPDGREFFWLTWIGRVGCERVSGADDVTDKHTRHRGLGSGT